MSASANLIFDRTCLLGFPRSKFKRGYIISSLMREEIYFSSEILVTEMEVALGVLYTKHPERHALVFLRKFSEMSANNAWEVGKFIDFRGRSHDGAAMDMLGALKEQKIPCALASSNIINFEVNFSRYIKSNEKELDKSGIISP